MTAVLNWRRFLGLAFGAAGAVVVLGAVGERVFVGWTDEGAMRRVERELTTRVQSLDATLSRVAQSLAGRVEVRRALADDRAVARGLFELLEASTEAEAAPGLAITIYDPRGEPRAWSGRPRELSRNLELRTAVGFAEVNAGGLRLVRVAPVVAAAERGGPARSLGAVVVERVLAAPSTTTVPYLGFSLETAVGRADIYTAGDAGGGAVTIDAPTGLGVHRFEVADASGQPLVTAAIRLDDIADLRTRWRTRVFALVLAVLGLTALFAGSRARASRAEFGYLRTFGWAVAGALVARGLFWLAGTPELFDLSLISSDAYRSVRWGALLRSPLDLLLTAALFCIVVALCAEAVNRRRWSSRAERSRPASTRSLALWHLGALGLAILALAAQQAMLRDTVDGAGVDLMHTALQPFDTSRVALQLALVLWSAATVWVIGVAMAAGLARWPVDIRRRWQWMVAPSAVLPTGLVIATGWAPSGSSLLIVGMAVALALHWRRLWTWFRHTDPLARGVATLGAILLPALPLYLALVELTDDARRRMVETDYAVQAAEHTDVLRQLLAETQEEVDRIPDLARMAAPPPGADEGALDTDRAFNIWRRTTLAASRVSSAVELYSADGTLNSR
ncbi:MAG: hypothetical protein ABGY72_12625, partial [bacterium]